MTETNILAWGVEVKDEVLAAHHRVEVQAGDVFLDLFLFYIRCGLGHQFGVELESALGLEQCCIDGEMDLLSGGSFVTVKEWW